MEIKIKYGEGKLAFQRMLPVFVEATWKKESLEY